MIKINALMRSYAMRRSAFRLSAEKGKPMRTPGISPIARKAMAYVLAGGRGSRLMELTAGAPSRRSPLAVNRASSVALSNAFNSGVRRIAVATQYKAHSLIRHLHRAWNIMRPIRNQSFDILPASQRAWEGVWYQGTADAVYQNLEITQRFRPETPPGAGGRSRLQNGLRVDAPTASGAKTPTLRLAHRGSMCRGYGFGVMDADECDVIRSFVEKPDDPPAMPRKPDISLASMGICVLETNPAGQLPRDASIPARPTTSEKTSFPISSRTGRRSRSFPRSCVRSAEEKGGYWRMSNRRCLLGGQC